ncbi:MAG: RNA methyltransferase [Casimicrobiaceae bacterium]|nr:RNA methyltransferase [Casimicrobiaceae bacterium]MCX8097825.1 RNA methyltransferase [Casimicrobiaceae bacterium]MDW8311385.1 RNA methyltransferase [Burkholderiales bacterium]
MEEAIDESLAARSGLGALERIVIVLSRPSHPGNIGAAARAMKTMGLGQLRLVRPEVFPSEIATARASGASDVLETAQIYPTLAAAIADCTWVVGTSARRRDFVASVSDVRTAARHCIGEALVGRVAVVFGCEMSGLDNTEVALCHRLAYIPTNPHYASLNLGSAVQVVCYELRMAAGLGGGYDAAPQQPATQAEIEQMFAHLERALTQSGFFDPRHPRRLWPRLRRLFARTRLEREEVDIFRGIARNIEQLVVEARRHARGPAPASTSSAQLDPDVEDSVP